MKIFPFEQGRIRGSLGTALLASAMAFAVTLTASSRVLADECGTLFCEDSWPPPNCFPLPFICGSVPEPGPIDVPWPIVPPTSGSPPPPPSPSPPPSIPLINPYALYDPDAALWGLSIHHHTDPKTQLPVRRYTTVSGQLLPQSAQQSLAHGFENGLNREGTGDWVCEHFSNLVAMSSTIECTKISNVSTLAPEMIGISGFGVADGNYPAPESKPRYTPGAIVDALKAGRTDDPVYQHMGPLMIFGTVFAAASAAYAIPVLAASPKATALAASATEVAALASREPGATPQTVARAMVQHIATTKSMSDVHAARAHTFAQQLASRIYETNGRNLADTAQRLAQSLEGPMLPMVETGDVRTSQLLMLWSRILRSPIPLSTFNNANSRWELADLLLSQVRNGMHSHHFKLAGSILLNNRMLSMVARSLYAFRREFGVAATHVQALTGRPGMQTINGIGVYGIRVVIQASGMIMGQSKVISVETFYPIRPIYL